MILRAWVWGFMDELSYLGSSEGLREVYILDLSATTHHRTHTIIVMLSFIVSRCNKVVK